MKQYSFIDKEEIEINCYKWESKEKNIKGYSKMNKKELLDVLKDSE